MAYKLITPPSEEPVSLDEAKLHCKVDFTEDDELISTLISAAREQAEQITGRAFVTQVWELALDEFPSSEIELQKLPAQSIASIVYLGAAGMQQTVDPDAYSLDTYGIRHWVLLSANHAWPQTYPAANAVKVRFVAGYGARADVPAGIKAWIKLAVETLYKNRGAVLDGLTSELPRDFFAALLDPFVVPRF